MEKPTVRRWARQSRRGVGAAVAVALAVAVPADAQVEWSTTGTATGLALGVYSGATLGLIGTLLPCNRTLNGGRCAATGAGVGGALGLAMGGLIGAQNRDALAERLEYAGGGALVGAAVGVALRHFVRQYQWPDVMAAAAVGTGVGAVPVGSALGAGAGAVVGGIVWLAFPRAGLPDMVLFTLAGTALGGMLEWADGAANAKRDANVSLFPITFSMPVR